jgi:DHA2 family multidrug resistance protein
MMLDRGELKDWFSSTEIIVEAVLVALGLYIFIVHMFTHERPFLEPALFRDRNLSAGLVLIFLVGVILFATMTLLPPFLQNLKGYPVVDSGLLLAPRGVGVMVMMVIVGRLIGRVDARLLIAGGLVLAALSLWEMSRFSLDVTPWLIIKTGVIQGFGLGLIFVPLSTITFSTLAPRFRGEATAMFSLLRNIGSSIGISIVIALLSRNTQINHATLAEHVTPFNPLMQAPLLPDAWSPGSAAGLAALNAEVTRQAASIAYLNDFLLMMWVTLVALPFVLLLKPPPRTKLPAGEIAAAVE